MAEIIIMAGLAVLVSVVYVAFMVQALGVIAAALGLKTRKGG